MKCNDCPRSCNVDREKNVGYCGCGYNASVAKVIAPFNFEEPCLGELSAVFFGGCSLRCSYCQNHLISRGAAGETKTDAELASMFDSAIGAIDMVTPTHFLAAIERALFLCGKKHRVIWNTSGYETPSAVEREKAFTDVFLADLKYVDGAISKKFSSAPDYFEHAKTALKMMRGIKDEWETVAGKRILKSGLVIRHLVLPGCAADSIRALDFIKSELGEDTVISLMSQFTPNGVGEPHEKLKRLEYKLVAEHALKLGFTNGYFQEFSSADKRYTPEF